jgi:hypothetical protein
LLQSKLEDAIRARDSFESHAQTAQRDLAALQQKLKGDNPGSSLASTTDDKSSPIAEPVGRVPYWAYGGWVCSALLGLALIGVYVYFKPLLDDAAGTDDHATHRIE